MNGMKRRRREQNKANRKHCTAICLSLLVLKVVVVEFLINLSVLSLGDIQLSLLADIACGL